MWYVIQTLKGKERKAVEGIRKDVAEPGEDVFIMENEKMFKLGGVWRPERKNLFPGYLFVVTERAEEFNLSLHGKFRTLKLMTVDGDIVPIRPEEEEFLMRLGGEEHVVKYSEGFLDGDEIVIETGPMKGLAGKIRKLYRHNREALITIRLFGRDMDVRLGVGIVKKI